MPWRRGEHGVLHVSSRRAVALANDCQVNNARVPCCRQFWDNPLRSWTPIERQSQGRPLPLACASIRPSLGPQAIGARPQQVFELLAPHRKAV